MSNYKCQINEVNPYTGLLQGSQQYVCAGGTTPQVLGFLGTHCSTPSTLITLSTTCNPKMWWDSSPYYQYVSYTCLPKVRLLDNSLTVLKVNKYIPVQLQVPYNPQPTGWFLTKYYSASGCSGTPFYIEGIATGVCLTIYSNASVLLGSVQYSCTGYQQYQSYNCTGPIVSNSTQSSGDTCGKRSTAPSTMYRYATSSVENLCVTGTTIPVPSTQWIVETYYDNDVCYDAPVQFSAWELDTMIPLRRGSYNTSVTCGSGIPTMTTYLNSSYVSYSRYLNTQCSYQSPAFTNSRSRVQGVPYTSVRFSNCPNGTSNAGTSSSSSSNALGKDEMKITKGGLAGVIISMLIIGAATALVFIYLMNKRAAVKGPPGDAAANPLYTSTAT